MPLGVVLAEFQASAAQCDNLIANAHGLAAGTPILPAIDQQQITVAAFLNLFIAWETFLESSLIEFATGSATLSGIMPVKYLSPINRDAAGQLIVGAGRQFFDYGNHEHVLQIVKQYLQNGYPYEPHLSSVYGDLSDLRTMRNASAHITANTQLKLESVAQCIFGVPQIGITLYRLLVTVDPRSGGGETIFIADRNKLLVSAELIARG